MASALIYDFLLFNANFQWVYGQERSLQVQMAMGDCHLLFNSIPVVATCLKGHLAGWAELSKK